MSYQWWTAWFNLLVSTKRMFPCTWRRPKRIRRSIMSDMLAVKWRTAQNEGANGALDWFQKVKASDSSQTKKHTKVLCSSSRRWQKVWLWQTAATSLPSSRTWKFTCGTVSWWQCTLKPNQGWDWPCFSPSSVAFNFPSGATPWPWTTKMDISEPYVTWSSRWVVKPEQLDL